MADMKEAKLVEVSWVDSRQASGWFFRETDSSEMVKIIQAKTVGWLVHVDADVFVIAQTQADDGDQLCGAMRIPTRCVTKTFDIHMTKEIAPEYFSLLG